MADDAYVGKHRSGRGSPGYSRGTREKQSMTTAPMPSDDRASCERCGEKVNSPHELPGHVADAHLDLASNEIVHGLTSIGAHAMPASKKETLPDHGYVGGHEASE